MLIRLDEIINNKTKKARLMFDAHFHILVYQTVSAIKIDHVDNWKEGYPMELSYHNLLILNRSTAMKLLII